MMIRFPIKFKYKTIILPEPASLTCCADKRAPKNAALEIATRQIALIELSGILQRRGFFA